MLPSLRRVLLGLGALSVPTFALAVGSDFDWYNARAILSSIPRTIRVVKWAASASLQYYAAFQDPGYEEWPQLHERWADSLLEVCRANGGIYVKAAQLMSTTGGVPVEYRKCLGELTDRAKPQPYSYVEHMMRTELGDGFLEVFADVDTDATAAASIAQVHRAHLATGEEVALKVQYPGLHKAAAADLSCLLFLSRTAKLVFPSYPLAWVFEELTSKIRRELDFKGEMENAKTLGRNLAHRKDIRVPELHQNLCTSKLLVMEWIEGCKVSDQDCLRDHGINPRSVALSLVDAFSEMTLVHGFVHGDPHPGNVVVKPLKTGDEGRVASLLQYLGRILTLRWWTPYQLVLVDHGRCIELTRKTRLEYCALWCYIVKGDKQKAAKIAREMCNGEVGAQLLPRVLYRRMTREERKKLKEELGFSDLIELLRGSPEALLDSLRVAGVVRHVASLLADIQFDRVYLECCQALWGLETSGVLEDELSDLHALMGENYWGFELGIRIRLLVMRMMMYVRSVRYSLSLVSDPPPVL